MLLQGIAVFLFVLAIISIPILLWYRKKNKLAKYKLPQGTSFLLHCYVPLYRTLNTAERQRFEERMRDFLSRTKITGVSGVHVENIDLIFIAAAAIVPLFGYPDWRYANLDEVLLYPDTFNRQYDMDGPGRNVLGMVGDGVMHRKMILSQPALRAGFLFPHNMHNTAIHEFVHLIDKADGATDGVPNYLLVKKEERKSWKEFMTLYMRAVKEGYTDINPYGATNTAEFFAVVSEYYFKQPQLLQAQYPELYEYLHKMYMPAASA